MLQRTHVLPPQLVVGDPCSSVIVLAPANRADVADVHIHARELDGAYHAPAVDGLGDGVEQAVAEALVLDHIGLVLRQAVVALGSGEPAPDRGRQQVAADLLAGEACQGGGGWVVSAMGEECESMAALLTV